MNEETLESELLKELKATSKRWFIAFCVMIILEIATICGFLWYISLPVEETETTISQDTQDIEGSDIKQIIGDDE